MYQLFFFSFLGHDGSVTSVNFSHDNNWLLTSSCDRTVRLWNPAHSDPLLIFSSVNHNFVSELGSAAKLKVSAEVLVSFLPLSIGSDNRELISSDDGNGNVNVTWKYNFISCVLLRDYFNSLNLKRNGELFRNQIGRSSVQVKKENEKFTVVCSRSPQNIKCGHFTLLFCRGRQRNVPKCKTHLQSDCLCSLNLLFYGVVVTVGVVVA